MFERIASIRWHAGLKNQRRADQATGGGGQFIGISLGDDVRAYPKRILAWHEMFVDTVGGISVAGVYCTLCGTMILYETTRNGVDHELGTSGFLFRSNKLMYDRATQSLWNTLWGKPVIGPLAAVLVTGSFIVEELFAIPGVGRAFVTSIGERDYGVIMGITLFYTVVVIVANLAVDVLYAVVDPRIRYRTHG